MNRIEPKKAALSLGLFLGGWHLVWSVLVALGVGQAMIDFIFWAHMIHVDYVVGPFEPGACITLIIVTFIVGYVFGWCFAVIWNRLHKAS